MGIDFKIDLEAGVIFTTAQGPVKAGDIQGYYEKILEDPLYRPGLNELVDARNANLEINGNDANLLAKWLKNFLPVERIAIVAGPHVFGWVRMIHGWGGDNTPIRLFEDFGSARKELGLPSEDDP